VKRFGEGWAHPANEVLELVATPVGMPCMHCSKPIEAHDLGVLMPFVGGTCEEPTQTEVAMHRVCLLRACGIEDPVTLDRTSYARLPTP
jgi:hypothetical protein